MKYPRKVNRKFLLNLADDIYNPKTKSFLRLCDGKLQNGPDPTDSTRPMHCGLGELYFAMTGMQPEEARVSEDDVIDEAVELSTLREQKEKWEAQIEKLAVPDFVKEAALAALNEDGKYQAPEAEFRRILNEIPSSNDDEQGDVCDVATFKARSKRVAEKLREAAELLK